MKEYFTIPHLNLYVNVIIAIIGGSFTYIHHQKNISLKKFEYQQNIMNDMLNDFFEMIHPFENILAGHYSKELFNKFRKYNKKIIKSKIKYGDKNTIVIVDYINNSLLNTSNKKENSIKNSELLAPFIILFSELKYQASGIESDLKDFYILTGYGNKNSKVFNSDFYNDIVKENNKLILELRLSPRFLILEKNKFLSSIFYKAIIGRAKEKIGAVK